MIAGLPRTSEVIDEGITHGLHLGAQVYVSLHGRPLGEGAMGEARRGVAMTPEQLITWWSMTKATVAVVVAQLWERGQVGLDDPIALHVPEFAANGKGGITIRHCLTHTGGFRGGDRVKSAKSDPQEWWGEVVSGICNVRPEPRWSPGRQAGYHMAAGTTMLAEVVRRVDGRAFDRYVREELFLPLGMDDCWVGMTADDVERYGGRLGTMHHTAGGAAVPLDDIDTEEWLTRCMPGSSGRADATAGPPVRGTAAGRGDDPWSAVPRGAGRRRQAGADSRGPDGGGHHRPPPGRHGGQDLPHRL